MRSVSAAGSEGQLRVRHLHSSCHCLGVHCRGYRKTLEYVGSRPSRNVQELLVRPDDRLVTVHLEDDLRVVEVRGGDVGGELLCVGGLHVTEGRGAVSVGGVAGGGGVDGGGRSHVLVGVPASSPQCEEDHHGEAYRGEDPDDDGDDGSHADIGALDGAGIGEVLHHLRLDHSGVEGLGEEVPVLDDLVPFISLRG